ncbi:MAG: CHAT domain-containing protein [Burkholderiaceae bacterium]|nr:CHAT domain-containing protein [Burkholderiaceae bacterium]
MAATIPLRLAGRKAAPALPALLRSAHRGAGEADDPFLPAGYLQPQASFDVGPAARSVAAGGGEQRHDAAADEVLVLELADGSTFVTSAGRLQAALAASHPELIGADGAILFERLRAEDAASRGLLADAGLAIGGLVSRVSALVLDAAGDPILDAARKRAGNAAEVGVSWAGTKALMWAVESRLDRAPGLYQWSGAAQQASDLTPPDAAALAAAAAKQQPLLVFIHGTASSTLGSFGDLQSGARDIWAVIERRFPAGVFAFEHRTLSESPIENALQLARALPAGARLNLVSHSRGGLVADLLCLANFEPLIDTYQSDLPGTGDADAAEAARVKGELGTAHAEQRAQLRELAAELRAKQFVVQRYVRVASPAQGTKLASANFDLFLSGVLTLIGQVPYFFGNPLYSAFKRVVLEIAKNRTNPHLVPGIEAMLPDSPMAGLLRAAQPQPGVQMAVIAGDIEGGHLLQRLGVLLSDFVFFDNTFNDLVVDTASMLGGIAPQAGSKVLFERGAEVSHFRYFTNADTRGALRDWLIAADPAAVAAFRALPGRFEEIDVAAESARLRGVAAARGGDDAKLPVVVVLPGVMGSHLEVGAGDRIWFDPADIALGGLDKIGWSRPDVEAEKLFDMFYGELCLHLAQSHRVEPFAYDWRQPLDVLAERLGEFLDRLLAGTTQPVRLLAHSMGGLVVRACIRKRRAVMDALMGRDGARLVMLGTPNQGAYSMVENLIGKGDTLRSLVRLDLEHDMQQVLDLVADFRGPLALLPKPGFVDDFEGEPDGGQSQALFQAATWAAFKPRLRDLWFGDGRCALPSQEALDAAGWLWRQDGDARPALPAEYETKCAYIFGAAPNTPCGIREQGGQLKMVGTPRGDGTVSWASGRIDHIGAMYYMAAAHGDLASTAEHFPALAELLATGATRGLPTSPPVARAVDRARPVTYDAGPPSADSPEAIARGLLGGRPRSRLAPRPKRRLEVTVKAMDLRFLSSPILVGAYEQDPIAGPQRLIDRELLDGDLSQRHSLGLYAGPIGSASVVLRVAERRGAASVRGAVVVGLGTYDGALSVGALTDAVRAGVLRYLLQTIDVLGKAERELPLAALLLGYNSSANMTIDASVEALVRGVLEANARFYETTRLAIRVARLAIVELYQDTAISAVYALRQMPDKLGDAARRMGTLLVCNAELRQGEGMRQRLFDAGGQSYWPRLLVTDADHDAGAAAEPPPPAEAGAAPERAARTAIATRLRFLYVGQRARAESVVQQRQPGLIEALVRQQIHNTAWQQDIGRMLFQLMVPHEFKDAARQLERVVLVVDAATANLPWELMLADAAGASGDALPMAVRTPVVRQLASKRFRIQVRQALERNALVVGNPSVEGFGAAFPDPRQPERSDNPDPPPLPGAEAEANAVAAVLGALNYRVAQAIGADVPASEVLALLYRQPYRLLHVAAHGIFDLPHRDGRRRSGVVLSGGLLITAAEIAAMESVPELVYLSCCHLGQIDATTRDATVRDGNKLAASIATELIEIGVRCVVVAGWAVNDEQAQLFGETFYRSLLQQSQPFGDAVYAARKAAWAKRPDDITWGAFQAYGDPAWRAEPRAPGAGAGSAKAPFASPEELLDALASLRADLARRHQSAREAKAQAQAVRQLIEQRCPASWLALPPLQSALGTAWRDLGLFDEARAAYLRAIQSDDRSGRVPIRDIEQLADLESRQGEAKPDEALIRGALDRLQQLDLLVSSDDAVCANPSRCALQGAVLKRLASVQARRVLAPGASAERIASAGAAMRETLVQATRAFRRAEGVPGQARFEPALALDRLALDALTPWSSRDERDAALALDQQCARAAAEAFRRDGGLANALLQPEALLVAARLEGSLAKAGEAGRAAFEPIATAYREVLADVSFKPGDLDTVLSKLDLMSRLHDALSVVYAIETQARAASQAAEHRRIADRLLELADLLQPGSGRRDDRPGDSAAPATAAPAAGQGAARGKPAAGRKRAPAKADKAASAKPAVRRPR